ncbi:GtrA family protein [uncultured Bifidobacterium sp.]|uniref:GtrA family protein n=1 Tax=uncultured Bifidobacterium sp. TaxID=165187 RepID=UPI00261CD844|nr:GtrA family protein [uncultured Bifidobacterium sp.]
MKTLIAQLVKFGLVGVVALVIDMGILNLLVGFFHMHNVLAGSISFLVSLLFNYVASMRYVFTHREDMARWMEMAVFFASAAIGLVINDAIIWMSTFGMNRDAMLTQHTQYWIRTNIGKLIATVVVAVWNFIIRKWLLDDKRTNAMNVLRPSSRRLTQQEMDERWERSFAHRLGEWSLTHTPQGWPR